MLKNLFPSFRTLVRKSLVWGDNEIFQESEDHAMSFSVEEIESSYVKKSEESGGIWMNRSIEIYRIDGDNTNLLYMDC